jgi:hypothetical protein
MNKRHAGLTIKSLMTEKNLNATRLSELTGRTRQQVHSDFHRVTIKDPILEVYSKALKVDKQAIYDRLESGETEETSFGANVLVEIKRMIEDELREKNEQIRSLQESLKDAQAIIKMAMGKPSLGEDDTCDVIVLNSLKCA